MAQDYNLQRFTGIGSRVGNYFISFNKSGFIISSGFYSKERIKDFSRVVFFFDSEKKSVGILFVKDNSEQGSFTLVHGNNGTTGSISARSFIFTYDLNKPEYFGRKVPKKINYQGNEIFVIDLIDREKQSQSANENG